MVDARDSTSKEDRTTAWIGSLTGPLFLVVAAWFVWGPDLADVPQSHAVTIGPDQISTEPMRQAMKDPATSLIGGFQQACMDCHRFFDAAPTDRQRTQHTGILFNHGMNNRCLNCHHPTDRSKLVGHDGQTIPFGNVVGLCAKCHGPTYRDWQKGIHGKTLGSWDPRRRKQTRLVCTHCHDPHSPALKPIKPLPGPHTLRMGRPPAEHDPSPESETVRNPLRVWTQPHRPQHEPGTTKEHESHEPQPTGH